jgi:virginiamycin B lyase
VLVLSFALGAVFLVGGLSAFIGGPRPAVSLAGTQPFNNASSPVREYPITPVGPLLKNAGPLSIAAGPDGTLWVAENSAGAIAQFFQSNGTYHQYLLPGSGSQPAYITVDGSGRPWFSDQAGTGTIWMFDPHALAFTAHPLPTSFSTPVGVAVDGQGNVWFAEDVGNKLGELAYPGYAVVEYPLPQPASGPAELALAPGAVWLTESLGLRIGEFNTTTHTFREFSPSVPLGSPVGIVLGGNGLVWISEHGGNSVIEFDPKTDVYTYFPTSPPPTSSGYANSAPATLVMDHKGRLWFVEHFSNRVGRLDSSIGAMDEFSIPSSGVYSVQSALDSQGNFWFTEFSSNRVGMVPGTATVSQRISAASSGVPGASVAAGYSVEERFIVTDVGPSPISLDLNTTSTFRTDGYTSPSEVKLNASTVSLSPGEQKTLLATITPDASLTPGSYSVGVLASDGGLSSSGLLVLQVTLNPLYTAARDLPDILFLVIVTLLLGNILLYQKIHKVRGGPSGKGLKGALVLGLSFFLMVQSKPAFAKCPGLPGVGSTSNGPDYYGIITLTAEVIVVVVLVVLLIRNYLALRNA